MKKLYTVLFITLLFFVTACSTPQKQWDQMVSILKDGEQQVLAVNLQDSSSKEDVATVQQILKQTSEKINKVNTTDQQLKDFKESSINLLTLSTSLFDLKEVKPEEAQAVLSKIQAELKNNLQLENEINTRFGNNQKTNN